MNYIAQLKSEVAKRDAELASLNESMNAFFAFLHSPKFIGTDLDGSRKDWIATGDVITWMREARTQALIANETA